MKVRLTGAEEVDKVIRGLSVMINDKLLQTAHVKAVKPLIDRAHYLAPVYETGNLAESIGVVRTKSQLAGSVGQELGLINVGPRRRGGYKGFAGHLVEKGTKERKTKSGASRGKVTSDPFMEPAWEQTKGQVESGVAGFLGNEVYKFMRRTIKKS
jgi:hypothetical protein